MLQPEVAAGVPLSRPQRRNRMAGPFAGPLLKYLYAVIQEFRGKVSFNKFDDFGEHAVDMHLVIRHAADRQRCALPEVVMVDLGYRNVKLVMCSVLDTSENFSFPFE